LIQRTVLAAAVLCLGLGNAGAVVINTDIYTIQSTVDVPGGIAIGDSVRVDSVVVIGVDIRPGTYGVYIQEQGGGPFSGVLAYRNTNIPMYENSPDTVKVGDVVQCLGVMEDFGGLTEIAGGAIGAKLWKQGTMAPLAPAVLPVDSLSQNSPNTERWEGVLVQVQNIVIYRVNNFNNWYFMNNAATDSLSGYEKMFSGQVVPQVGDTLLTVTGVADYAFNERRIAPRTNDDIVFAGAGPPPVANLVYSISPTQVRVRFSTSLDPISATNILNYTFGTTDATFASYSDATKTVTVTVNPALVASATPEDLDLSDIRSATNVAMEGTQTVSFIGGIAPISLIQQPVSASNDTSVVANQQVTLRGVVTAVGDNIDFPNTVGGFYVQTRGATEYGGIFVFGSPTTPAKHDSVMVSGLVTEFGVGPETEITSVDLLTIYGQRPPIVALDRTLAQVSGSNAAEGEKYEGMLVRVQGAEVKASTVFQGDPFDIVQEVVNKSGAMVLDSMRVDDLAIEEGEWQATQGDQIDVTGIVRYSGTAPFRRLQPRNWNEPPGGDIHIVGRSTVDVPPVVPLVTTLRQNHPNPFNPSTNIEFVVGRAGQVDLRVFDLRGRLVATLFDQVIDPGQRSVRWDGLDDNGQSVPTGLYLYRLVTPDANETRKMLLLK
jgi:predicted extracellular nuclease